MQISEDSIDAKYKIQKFENNTLTISNKEYKKSILLMPNEIINWQINTWRNLTLESLEKIISKKPEVIILSSNEKNFLPNLKILSSIMSQGIGVEHMNIEAACRTYTILASEKRAVAVAFILG